MTGKKRIQETNLSAASYDEVGQNSPFTTATLRIQPGGDDCCGKRTKCEKSAQLVATQADGAFLPSMSYTMTNALNGFSESSSARGVDALNIGHTTIGQAFYQRYRKKKGISSTYVDVGDMTHVCVDCHALFWLQESKFGPRNGNPVYTGCCQEGRIRLPPARPTPDFLEHLLNPANGPKSVQFKNNIRGYNTMFAFTSMGANIDKTVIDGHGPYVFKISGQIYHLMGSLIPLEGEHPKFAQLYIYDTENEVANRQRVVDGLDSEVITGLINMLDESNELVQYFRSVRNKYDERSLRCLNLTILDNEIEGREYNVPSSSEVAGLIVGDIGMHDADRDVVVDTFEKGLQQVSRLHPKFMAFQYPLLFPYGEDGYHIGLKLCARKDNMNRKRAKMSMCDFMSYQIHERANESSTLLKGGRLLQQFLVDAYANVEEDRLFYIRTHQPDIRCETYEGICDASLKGYDDGENVGKRIILPSTHTGSPRYMIKHYHDAMALCRKYGPPDLFITFTCNPKWHEIGRALLGKHGSRPEDRPDIVARIFKIKHDDLISYVKSGKPFGRVIADVATIEFQKRGLPHSHMLFWLAENNKCYSAIDIDSIISAELPDKKVNPTLYDIVNQFMIHGPCGVLNPKAPCMRENKCKKSFPKEYKEKTLFAANTFPVYMRRDDDSKFVLKNNVRLDNRFVVPYNAELLLRYNAHINVESCCQSVLIKYLFKYISKGPDRARVGFQFDLNDEIATYLNCRYISPPEAAWRLFEYPIHSRHPPVELLRIHLPGQQTIVFGRKQPLASVIAKQGSEDTMLTAWFHANSNAVTKDIANKLTFAEFPSAFVWNNDKKTWTLRQRGYALGRLPNISPTSGELYYLRLLLNTRKGCTNFESIRTIRGVEYSTYQEACRALGLLGDDKEWSDALTEAVPTATSYQLRHLFVTILLYCNVSNPCQLFETHWRHMCDDILYNVRYDFMMPHLDIPESELRNSLLFELEQLLFNADSSLAKYHLPLPDKEKMLELENRQLREELNYDRAALQKEYLSLVSELNDGQRLIYENVIDVVSNKSEGLFFVYGHGGTGKTFLWHTIISKLRSEGKIVLAVASSGIASLLLPNGRTAHSRFKIPIDLIDGKVSTITKGTNLAKLIEKTDLIIWDEAPMTDKCCFESLDYTLRDILSYRFPPKTIPPFGGLPIVLGGDFRQILPVKTDGTKSDVIDASLNSSLLWPLFKIFYLTENMRLRKKGISEEEKKQISEFAQWLLHVGDGNICGIEDDYDKDARWIEIPADMVINNQDDPIGSIFHATYPNFHKNYNCFDYIRERAVITPKNTTVVDINNFAIDLLPGDTTTYLSCDSICLTNDNAGNLGASFPPELLNSIEINGLPSHKLVLKKGMPVMLLRNLNQTNGLCNGTRLIITNLFEKIIEARVLTGTHVNEKVFLPRILLSASDLKWPFVLRRRQFPIRACYGMTINKSQGQSLKQVGLYLPQPVFSHGQLYVALSRVTSREGINILVSNEEMPNTFTKNIVYKDVLKNLQSQSDYT